MARNWVEVRKLDETKPAFDKLKKFMLAIHGDNAVMYGQMANPWCVAERGYTNPLLFQTSREREDAPLYPSSKRVMSNMLLKHFLPSAGYTLKRIVEVRPQAFWIEVNELKTIAFHVFTFRGGGIGVSVGPILGDMGMKADIKDSGVLDASKRKKDALIASARSKLTSEEREALGL
jgi:hypothetical protein